VLGHTDSVDLRAALVKEFHNFDVTIVRSLMQGSMVVVAYGLDVNGDDFEMGRGAYR
jgi:hypothetical protein